jgi:phospholipid transport system transporter-binding protein
VNNRGAATGFAATDGGAGWTCTGPLTFANAAQVHAAASVLPLPSGGGVDFAQLGAVDSSAVAVLLALKRRAIDERKPLRFAHMPPLLSALAGVYGVERMLDDDPGR